MFPRKACVDVNVYTHTCEFELLLIPCFLLQKNFEEEEKWHSFNNERYEKLEEKKKEADAKIVHVQVSYMFGDFTIKFTSPYRLACS